MREKKHRLPLGGIAQVKSPNALMAQLQAKGFTESAHTEVPTTASNSPDTEINLSHAGTIVLSRERKGHGGKTVTLISGLTLPAPRMDILARALRKGLGCGATVEQGKIMLQGDIVERAREWLAKHGATTVQG